MDGQPRGQGLETRAVARWSPMFTALLALHLALSSAFATPEDIVVTATVPADIDQLVDSLSDINTLQRLFPESCVTKWAVGTPATGVGATARVTYKMASMRRRLTMTVQHADNQRVDLDHEGNKGFVTRFAFASADAGTAVTLTTFITAPPKPFQKIWARDIHPAWTTCWQQTLENLGNL